MTFTKARRLTFQAAKIFLIAALAMGMRAWGQDPTNAPAASNSADPLLDLFVQKGFVTQQEAEQVEAEAATMRSNQMQMPAMPPSRWAMSNGFKKMQLYGDARLRYEDRSEEDPAGNRIDLQRYRYAVRFGVRGDLYDNFYYGLRLETGNNPRSPSVTFGSSASESPYYGPFGKSEATMTIGQLYFGWRWGDWLDLTVGKMPNPLYTTPMVWSGNISPEGFAENFKHTVGQADLFATFGQFLYADMNPSEASAGLDIPGTSGVLEAGGGQKEDNIFMLTWQGGFNYHINTNMSAKAAATLYQYIGLQSSSGNALAYAPYYGDPYVGEGAYYYAGGSANGYASGSSGYVPGLYNGIAGAGSIGYPFNQVGLDHLFVVEVPFEFNFKISRFDARVFGDASYNLDGAARARDAATAYQTVLATRLPPSSTIGIPHSFPAQTSDVKAYQIGFAIGSRDALGLVNATTSQRHAWEVRTYWQHIEQYSLDPNLLDVDFFEGAENLQGIYVAAAYGLTGNLIATFRYGHASRINNLLGTGGSDTGDIPQINPINSFDIYQVDLTLRF